MFVNLTPHEVNIISDDGVMHIPPSGKVARCEQLEQPAGEIDGIRVTHVSMGEPIDLPPSREGVTYIVSHIVLQKATWRKDLVKPGALVRNAAGEIVGCEGLYCL